MKALALRSILLLALSAGAASASGINLGWDDCGGLPASANRVFACNTNTGPAEMLIGSFVTPAGVDSLNGNEIVIDLMSSGATLPAWWTFQKAGTCRQTSLSTSFVFLGTPNTCLDYWEGNAVGGFDYAPGFGAPNRARLRLVCAITTTSAHGVPVGTEVYSFKVLINHAKTVGGGACGRCTDGVCIVLSSIRLTQNVRALAGARFLQTPAMRNYVTWQTGAPLCPDFTPTHRTTWGAVKSMYR